METRSLAASHRLEHGPEERASVATLRPFAEPALSGVEGLRVTIAQLSKPLTCLIARLLQPPFRSVNARRIYGASAASTPESSTKPHLLSSILLAALAAACGGDDGGIQNPGPVESVTITAPTTEIRVGQTVQLTATARDANGTVLERGFEWISGIGTVASVSQTGLVTGHVKGQSEIRAITDDVTGRLVITVEVAPPPQ